MKFDYEKLTNVDKISWKMENKKKMYYSSEKCIGGEYEVIKFLIAHGISSSKAHKLIGKIKESEL
jgi:hypothetical protein